MEETLTPPLISISLDISGSTGAKAKIVDLHGEDTAKTRKLYRDLLRQFYRVEGEFYQNLLKHRVKRSEIFLVKTIGDEAWIVVEVPGEVSNSQFTRYAFAVLDAGINALTRTVAGPDGPLSLKMFVDFLPASIEVSELRLEEFRSVVASAVELDRETTPEQVAREIEDRLFGGVAVKAGYPKAEVAWRSDFVGLDVDRFFRCTKAAQPGVLAAGKRFAERLALEGTALPTIDNQRCEIRLAVPRDRDGDTKYEPLLVTRETIRKADLKGLSADYSIFHVSSPILERLAGRWQGA